MASPPMKRALELADYVSISAGMALSVSGYAMMSEMFGVVTGPGFLIAIVLAALLCMAISGSIAELASAYPSAPGVRTYFRATLGEYPSLLATFSVLAVVFLFAGVESHTLALSVRPVLPLSPHVLTPAIIVLIVCINLLGLQLPRLLQLVLGVLLIAGTFVLGGLAMLQAPSAPPEPVASPGLLATLPGICAAMGSAIFLFTGFEWVTPLGLGPASYRRLIPLSMPVALGLLMAMYVLIAAGLERHFAPAAVMATQTPHLALGEHVAGFKGVVLAAGLSLLATLTTFNAGLMGACRLVYALAREGRLPKVLSRVSMRTGAPVTAVLAVGCGSLLGAVVELAFDLQIVAALVAASLYCVVYGAFVWAGYRLRAKAQHLAADGFRNPVPRAVQVALGIGLPLLGAATAVSDPALRGRVCLGLVAVLLACHLLARWSLTSKSKDIRASGAVPLAASTTADRRM